MKEVTDMFRRNKRKKTIRRFACLVLTALLTVQGMPVTAQAKEATRTAQAKEATQTAQAKEATQTTQKNETTQTAQKKEPVYVKTLEDFLNFAQACNDADYSVGREVFLQADLDLGELPEGTEFHGITSFSGTFRGYYHSISGLDLTEDGEAVGLFRYVEQGALIRDLTVKGTIECSESRIVAGGIAGINAGTIRECIFRGVVSSLGETGGIVGINGTGGSVIQSKSFGSVNGVHKVGGIAGVNHGVISDCTNSASVNAGTKWLDFEEEEEFSMSVAGIWNGIKEKIEEGTDFGGIAGWNGGVIAGCENKAVVGYQHAGKNVGGIAGRQEGQLINCTNSGRIYGKQDVGGVTGQLEPKTAYKDAEVLGEKVEELHDLMDQMIGDMDRLGTDLHGDFNALNEETKAAGDTTDALMTEMRDVVEKNVEVINQLAQRIDYAMNHFGTVMSYLNQALNQGSTILNDMDRIKEDLDLYDQMEEDDYDAAKNRRLVLESGLGGVITADNADPAQGAKVTVTVRPQKGYELLKLTAKPYGKEAEDVTASVLDGKYVIDAMPAENVALAATFQYVGSYVLESGAGGKAFLSEDERTLRVEPAAGYRVAAVSIDGGENLYEGADGEIALPAPIKNGKPQVVFITFEKEAGVSRVHVTSGTGGTITAEPAQAAPGERVTLKFTSVRGYEPDPESFSVKNVRGEVIPFETGLSYSFVMPEGDAYVEGSFRYQPDENTGVYVTSNPGGKATAFTNPATSNVQITISCEDGYDVEKMTITDGAEQDPQTYVILPSEMTKSSSAKVYNYELSGSTLTNPVRADVTFVKTEENRREVSTASGVGGRVLSDKTAVKAGDVIRILAVNEPGYALSELTVNGGENLADRVEGNAYEYEVPEEIAGAVEIQARFQPVKLILESVTVSGKGSYAVTDGEVNVTILPDAGFSVEKILLTMEDGTEIPLQKQHEGSEEYRFPAKALGDHYGRLQVTFLRRNNKEAVEDARESLENQTDQVVDGVNNMSAVADRIRELLTDEYGESKKPEDLTPEELEELGDLMAQLAGYVSDTGAAAGAILGDAATIAAITGPYAEEAMEKAGDDLDQLSKDARAMSDSLKSAGKELQGIVDYLNALDKLRAVNLSDNFDRNSEKLKQQLDTVADILDQLDQHAYLHSQKLEDDMRAVNDKMNEVLTIMVDRLDHAQELASGENVIEDLSADDPESLNASKVSGCMNRGVVTGDRNVGGIAGSMGVEEAEISDNETKVSVGNQYVARAVLRDCENDGFITVKTENAGGIVGNLEIGYVAGCLGSGRVRGEEANYVGGIAGKSEGTIQSCSSMAVLEGQNYVGGIAGQAGVVRGSYSMVTVLDAKDWVGAIVGKTSYEEEERDVTIRRANVKNWMSENYYVSSSLYGVNGVSYQGAAQGVTYRELLDMGDVPAAFEELTITFIDSDQNFIRKLVLPYGADLSKLEYPDLKAGSGDYVNWSGLVGDRMEGNLVLEASENENVTILSGIREGEAKPVVLAKGTFKEEAGIRVEAYNGPAPEGIPLGSVCHYWRVTLENTSLDETAVTKVRLLREEEGKATVFRLDDGKWTKLDAKSLGSYEEVEMQGTDAVFCVATLDRQISWGVIAVIAGLSLVILCMLFVILHLVKKQRKQKRDRD